MAADPVPTREGLLQVAHGDRGFSLIEVGVSIVVMTMAAFVMGNTFSSIVSTNSVAEDMVYARQLVARQFAYIDNKIDAWRPDENETGPVPRPEDLDCYLVGPQQTAPTVHHWQNHCNNPPTASPLADNGDAFPNLWVQTGNRVDYTYQIQGGPILPKTVDDPVDLAGAPVIDRIRCTPTGHAVGVGLAAVDTLKAPFVLPDTNGWHLYQNMDQNELDAMTSRALAIQVIMAPLEIMATQITKGTGFVVNPYRKIRNPASAKPIHLSWIMQVNIRKNGRVIYRVMRFGK